MQREIILKENRRVRYIIKKSMRARKLRLAVKPNGEIVLTIPRLIPEFFAEKFIREKSDWLIEKIDFFSRTKDSIFFKIDKEDYLKNKENALSLVKERLKYFNNFYGFSYNNICVKNQKTRWGSCSAKGNLNFNYKILFLSEELRDYIIVHELCHLKELNHSKNFWNLVAQTIPNFKEIKHKLKNIGLDIK